MQINLQITGLDAVKKQLSQLSRQGINEASSKAINDTAFKVRKAMQSEFVSAFDRVTPYIKNSPYITQMATPARLEATIEPDYIGGKGIEPKQVLRAEIAGGRRHDKRSEIALRNAGILPRGYQTAIPKVPFPRSDDGRGNLRGPFLVQLISYFQAFAEQGYSANMTARRKKNLAKFGVTEKGGYKTINGVVYFVSHGELPGGKGVHDRANKTIHLAPGIWAKSGTHGSNVRPVLMFVKAGSYTPRISTERIVKDADLHNYFSTRLRYRIRQAFEATQS